MKYTFKDMNGIPQELEAADFDMVDGYIVFYKESGVKVAAISKEVVVIITSEEGEAK